MSQWMKVKAEIKCLKSFKQACVEHNVTYDGVNAGQATGRSQGLPVVANLVDEEKTERSWYSRDALLCKEKDHFRMIGDSDPHYSSLANRLGPNMGKLMQSYAKNEISKNAQLAGGFVTAVKTREDGAVVMKVAM